MELTGVVPVKMKELFSKDLQGIPLPLFYSEMTNSSSSVISHHFSPFPLW